ncbi:hypothetical protein [Streptacidiphilus sp. BW17]
MPRPLNGLNGISWLSSMVDPLTRDAGDERFDFGLDVLLDGLLAQADRFSER